jgi:hypothetical protein
MITNTMAASDAELVRKVLGFAAHLVAAMRDPSEGMAADSLSFEVRDSLDGLQEELDRAGLLTAYKRNGGYLGVW